MMHTEDDTHDNYMLRRFGLGPRVENLKSERAKAGHYDAERRKAIRFEVERLEDIKLEVAMWIFTSLELVHDDMNAARTWAREHRRVNLEREHRRAFPTYIDARRYDADIQLARKT